MNDHNNGFSSYDAYYNNSFQFNDVAGTLNEPYFSSLPDDLPFVPFVQIHTTDVQSPANNFGNIFHRNQSKAEIKSEPIKSEHNEINQNSHVTTRASSIGSVEERSTPIERITPCATVKDSPIVQSSASSNQKLCIFSCTQCLFLSTSNESLQKHIGTAHQEWAGGSDKRKKLNCPGCKNVFYTTNSYKVHLELDHLMDSNEADSIVADRDEDFNVPPPQQQNNSRIYLKDVQYLCEPQQPPPPDNSLSFCDSNYQTFDSANSDLMNLTPNHDGPERKKQKISIKSVDVLCEPSLMHREMDENFYNPSDYSTNCYDTNQSSLPEIDFMSEKEPEPEPEPLRPSRPKIYIKNVDILKEPIFFPTNNVTNILNMNDDLRFNSVFQMPPPPPSSSSEELRSSLNSTPNDQVSPFNSNALEDFPIFLDTPEIAQEQPRIKIYLKNTADILEPQALQLGNSPKRTTNFIHLRTVDELNLMNKNEMENLIAPNLDQNNCIGSNSDQVNMSENSKNSDEAVHKYTELESIPSNWSTSDYVFDGLENIIDSSSNSICGDQKSTQFDLTTSQKELTISEEDVPQVVVTDQEDPDILFDCAQEIINEGDDSQIADDVNDLEPIIIEELKAPFQESVSVVSPSAEKGRIYVSDNLMADTTADQLQVTSNVTVSTSVAESTTDVAVVGKKSNRGRPIGANKTGITRTRKLYGSAADIDVGIKCDLTGCAFRFKKIESIEYHRKCHMSTGPQKMQCPECLSTDFSNWNTLHTHLWRSHKVDMELYSCELCNFKTPIYSRLANTHSKIHFDERNYKCDQCEKAFKNSKQLKNHRRWHRTSTTPSNDVHKCTACGLAFSNFKSLKEHICKENEQSRKLYSCTVCSKVLSSKSALKLHTLTHETASKFKCESCNYVTNDHNAFRRHKMTHDKTKMYKCPHCDYKSIQSATYQKHIQQKHPDSADNLILKCSVCTFSTINQSLFNVHIVKHDTSRTSPTDGNSSSTADDESISDGAAAICSPPTPTETESQPRNKIKVKSDLVLTDPTKFLNTSNAMLLQSFDDGVT